MMDKRWSVGFKDRGMGAGDFAVITEGGGFQVDMTCCFCNKITEDIPEGVPDEDLSCSHCKAPSGDDDDFEIVKRPGGDLIVECPSREVADHIVDLHNAHLEAR